VITLNRRVWLDVGAHLGERTLNHAEEDAGLVVYAFEPNVEAAAELFGKVDNFVIVPMAVAEEDGFSSFYINEFRKASSLLPFDRAGLERWEGKEKLHVAKRVLVPTIRLDTFLDLMQIEKVEFLKIDAQGGDFGVLKSAGERLNDIRKIVLEVVVNPIQLYQGSADKSTIVSYMEKFGFFAFWHRQTK
jgi:FkbM family methyltransferase